MNDDDVEDLYSNEWIEFAVVVIMSMITLLGLGFFVGYFT